jgi:hypothetical protein
MPETLLLNGPEFGDRVTGILPFWVFRFYEAAVRDFTHPARSGSRLSYRKAVIDRALLTREADGQ